MAEIVTDMTVSNLRVMGTLAMGSDIVADSINGLILSQPVTLLETNASLTKNGTGFFVYDESNPNSLMLKFKKSNGDVITKNIVLTD
jgi:hypothetical protein